MASQNFNIKQITDKNIGDCPLSTENINVPTLENNEIVRTIEEVEYATVVENVKIFKLGYCCDLSSIIYPIFLEIQGEYKPFFTGREGMYEMQIETFMDSNTLPLTKENTDVIITGVKVPTKALFTLDYII